jgi:ubiquinone/menaquinone biosynthesis C-methylase UbiE
MTGPGIMPKGHNGDDGATPPAAPEAKVLRYFNTVAEDYSSLYDEDSLWGYVLRERRQRLFELLAGTQGKVLDVGCGPAVMTADILDLGCDVWGVDGSPRMIEECGKRFGADPHTHFEVMNAEALGFEAGFFDAAICIGVIDRVPQPERAIAEMARVLKPNGVLIVSFPNLVSPYALWRSHVFYPAVGVLKRIGAASTGREKSPNICSAAQLWSPGGARRAMERLVGPVRATAYFNYQVLFSPLDTLLPNAAKGVAQGLEPLHAGSLKWLGAGFIVKAEKRA